jgi:branched-chain amino acid transport system ATP-binding protein
LETTLAESAQGSSGPGAVPAPPLLKVDKLSYSYGDLRVLWEVDLEVRKGEIVAVVGANGAGKSTTLRNISRLLTPASGHITFDGEDLSRLSAHEVVELGIVHVPEGRRIFPEMTVLENLRLGGYIKAARADRARNIERAFSLFPHLRERASQLGGTLSGGEQQMLAIARGLMANPRLLLFDEPSLGLAPLLVKSMFEIIRTINQQGATVLLVEQNVYQSLRIAHRGYALETGRIVLTGGGPELLVNEHVKKAFLGI